MNPSSRNALLLTGMVCMLMMPHAAAQPAESTVVPWDTLVADIKMIDTIVASDTVKGTLMAAVFRRYRLTADDYRAFYDHLMAQPRSEQQVFFDRVKKILQEKAKEATILPDGKDTRPGTRRQAR